MLLCIPLPEACWILGIELLFTKPNHLYAAVSINFCCRDWIIYTSTYSVRSRSGK